jgi:hypothetical protein
MPAEISWEKSGNGRVSFDPYFFSPVLPLWARRQKAGLCPAGDQPFQYSDRSVPPEVPDGGKISFHFLESPFVSPTSFIRAAFFLRDPSRSWGAINRLG